MRTLGLPVNELVSQAGMRMQTRRQGWSGTRRVAGTKFSNALSFTGESSANLTAEGACVFPLAATSEPPRAHARRRPRRSAVYRGPRNAGGAIICFDADQGRITLDLGSKVGAVTLFPRTIEHL
jgi:hypothetical protein